MAEDAGRQRFAERRFQHAWTPTAFDRTRAAQAGALLQDRPRGRMLDVGCYDGRFVGALVGPEQPVVGVDVAPDALALARERAVIPVRAQVERRLPFHDGAFATILAAEVIEHVFDTEAFLAELFRLARPGGWLLLTTPNLVALSGRAKLLLGRSPANVEFDAGPGTSGHIRYFTFDTLETLLRRVGWQPRGRWTNVVHFSVFGSSEWLGRVRPGLGHTLISLAIRPA